MAGATRRTPCRRGCRIPCRTRSRYGSIARPGHPVRRTPWPRTPRRRHGRIANRWRPRWRRKPANNAPVVSKFGSQYTPRGRDSRSSTSLMASIIQERARKIPAHALIPVSDFHAPRRSRRRRGPQSPADAAGRHDPPARGRTVFLAAPRPQDLEEGGAHRPRGNGPRRCPGAVHADDPAGRAVEGIGPLEQIRARAAALQGPA